MIWAYMYPVQHLADAKFCSGSTPDFSARGSYKETLLILSTVFGRK
jgi:hypothetical protein